MLRSLSATGLVLALSACQPDLPHSPPSTIVTAVFDPTTSQIPLPNDLAFLNPPNSVCPPPANMLPAGSAPACAQAELLAAFAGAFPSDQEVGVTIDFVQINVANGGSTKTAPDLDFSTFTEDTVFVIRTAGTTLVDVPFEPLTEADYVKAADHGTLTLHNVDGAPWPSGAYAVGIRGGASGVKTKDGNAVAASQVFYLLAQGLDMTDPKNIGLLKAQTGSTAAAIDQGRQLNQLIALYKTSLFTAADSKFPHQELAIATTFKISPAVTNVEIDPGRSKVPLPIDLLRDPASGKLSALAACTLAGSELDADGKCPTPAAAGFAALDGFSTTGAILGPTSDVVKAATVTPTSLLLYDLTDPANPVQVNPATLIIEPCEFTFSAANPMVSGCTPGVTALAPVIAIQPAGATEGDKSSVFRTKPLKDNTDYAVVMTTAILDRADKPIGPGTVAKVLRFANPITVGGKSGLQGIDDGTAAALEKMRLQLKPVFATLAAGGTDASKVAIAYTFKTQTILSQANQLAALPYSTPPATARPVSAVVASTPAAAFAKYGAVPGTGDGEFPLDNIDEILEVDITTFNALDPASGAFLADPSKAAPEVIHVLISTPKAVSVTNMCGPLKCAPMMIFRHGLSSGRAAMLAVADTNAAAGMVTVAIDAAKHGDRSFCTSGPANPRSGCVGGAACVTALPAGAQGDMNPPGSCGAAGFVKAPLNPTAVGATDGIPAVSGNFLISANFFRTRDTLRQDLIDQSQLVRALAFDPTGAATPSGHTVFDHMAGRGVMIDPATIYYSGQSLGALQGTMTVATNPRISKAVFNVGGGTIVDVFTNSSSFEALVKGLLMGLGIERGTPEFLQFLVVAKTILDPADPINFAGHLTANTLPNLLAGGLTAQDPKKVLSQIAFCDSTIPNPFNFLHASNLGVTPLPPTGAPGTAGKAFTMFVGVDFAAGASCSATTAISHGFLTNWTTPTVTATAQRDLAAFVTSDTVPLSIRK